MPKGVEPARGAGGKAACVRYTPELGREICARVAAGESQHALAREPGMPSRRTFRDWALREPEFGAAFEAAKLEGRRRQIAADREADLAPGRGRLWRRMMAQASPKRRRGGSVSILTPQLAEDICLRIAGGETVLALSADPDMPCAGSIYGWARREDWFREMYVRAKEIAADVHFDLAYEVAMEATEDSVRGDRLRVQVLRWRLALSEPKKYGVRRMLGPAAEGERDGEGGPQPFGIELVNFVPGPGGGWRELE
ncbi:hypothetical protein [Phenylobacterium sp. 58.2.17]|uniref:terminase small subunit-like protein n=1 Tax=Phenylobacterium sp. 58.2.17 TaxID=2969306 RepID=UPI00226495EB|nr:hypothetical protein [Phenylobacterium sp. 58.2.17]MCX7587332.1 hypothetical protein [Phenylobacterium sp. 58.2.17]